MENLSKKMKTSVISEIIKDLEKEIGTFEKDGVTIAAGGDIFIQLVANGTLEVTCSLPKSHTHQQVVIRQVPTGESNEKIHAALAEKGYKIRRVHRFSSYNGTIKKPSNTVALEFLASSPKEIVFNGMLFRLEKHIPSPYRCKKCQQLGHTENYRTLDQKCPNCSYGHEDMPNCTNPPNCANCKGDHPASSPSCHHFINWRKSGKSPSGYKAIQQGSSSQSYSEVAKRSITSSSTNPDVEIMKSQIEAIQSEMASLKAGMKQNRPLEEKVTSLESTVNTLQKSLSKLENGQHAAINQLDKLVDLISRILPQPEDNNDEMENSEAEAPMHACCPGKGNEEPKLAKSKETL